MNGSLSSSADNLDEVFHNKKCQYCKSSYAYVNVKDDSLICKCIKL